MATDPQVLRPNLFAIICVDIDEFDLLNDFIWAKCQAVYGSFGTTWAIPIIHPVDGRIALIVKDRIMQFLSDKLKARIVELPPDWFE